MNHDSPTFEQLCHAVLEGSADESDLELFRERLHRSAADREAYHQQVLIHALLIWQNGRAGVPESLVLAPVDYSSPSNLIEFGKSLPFRRAMLAAAAGVTLLLGLSFWLVPHRDQEILSLAPAKGVSVDILASSESPYQVGQRVVLERLDMQTGSLRFRISSGAVVDFEGPVSLEFVNPMLLRLERGSINTDVGNEANGFVVETPTASVLDIGTSFGTSVSADGSTDIAVFEGEVEVYRAGVPLTQASRLASLVEGEAARMSARDAKLERVNMLTLKGGRLQVRGLNSPDSPVVLNVSDNIKQANFYRCYTVVPGGMADGALASLTLNSHLKLRWHAMPGQVFPEELKGADLIGTFQSFAKRERGEPSKNDIRLDLSRPCAVYVLFDTRATPPAWLQRDFRDTGLRLRSGPWGKFAREVKALKPDAEGELNLTHSVWRRDVLSAAAVTLGPPGIPGKGYPYAMYGVAVKALESSP